MSETHKAIAELILSEKDYAPFTLANRAQRILAQDSSAWRDMFNLSAQLVLTIIDNAITENDTEGRRAMFIEWQGIITELTDEHATPLERILIEQVAITRLHLQIVTLQAETAIHSGVSLAKAAYYERRINAAQRRHLRAAETLARVRKIERTRPLQVNTAQQQVNVASEGGRNRARYRAALCLARLAYCV